MYMCHPAPLSISQTATLIQKCNMKILSMFFFFLFLETKLDWKVRNTTDKHKCEPSNELHIYQETNTCQPILFLRGIH